MNSETLKRLTEPMPYQWRVQEIKEWGCSCVAYVDSRDVQNRLDEVVGPENWQSDYKGVNNILYGGIAIKIGEEWVWKWDCGTESNVEKEKGEASDAFKRAAVKWGIGRFLYDLKIEKLESIKYEKNGKLYPKDAANNKPIFDGQALTDYINKKRGAPTKISTKEAEKRNAEIKKAVLELLIITDSKALVEFVGKQVEYVRQNQSFQDAAKKRQTELKPQLQPA